MIEVENVTKVYEMPGEELRVLDGISFQVGRGERNLRRGLSITI